MALTHQPSPRLLLKRGFGRRQGCLRQETDSQTPLHLAVARCHRTLKARGGKSAIEDFQDYVKPILDACPDALKVKNQLGQRGSSVLEALQTDIAKEEMGGEDSDYDHRKEASEERDRDDEDQEEKRWREKLRDECDFEMDETVGRFKEGQHYWQEDDERGRETFKEFAERIEREYRERYRRLRKEEEKEKARHAKAKTAASSSSKSSSKAEKEIDWEKRKQYEEMKRTMMLKNNKLDYERRWDEFFKNDNDKGGDRRLYSFNELPWPKPFNDKIADGEAVRKLVREMLDISTFTVGDEEKERERRLEIKRWHPDKVMQKINVKPEDAEFVALVVKELAQALNSLKPK